MLRAIPFRTALPELSVVLDVRKAGAASAPGPYWIIYKLYKNCPSVLRVAWQNQVILLDWQLTVFILKEQNSCNMREFGSIDQLNVDGQENDHVADISQSLH